MLQLDITEYIAVFWLNDILFSTATQRDGPYEQKKGVNFFCTDMQVSVIAPCLERDR